MIMVMVLTVTTVAVTAKPANAALTPVPAGSANVQAPALVGAVGVGTPAICYDQSGENFFIFARGSDGALWYEVYNFGTSSWSGPTSLGGKLTSDPSVISEEWGNFIQVAVRGTDGGLWWNSYSDGSWGGWLTTAVHGKMLEGTGPSSVRSPDLSGSNCGYEWFVTGTDHALWGWNLCGGVWQNLGGYLTSSPAAAAPTSSSGFYTTANVFVRGGDGAVWVRGYDSHNGGAWSGWQKVGGQLASGTAPAAYSYGSRYDILVTGTNGGMWHNWYSGAWSGWENVGGYLTSSPAIGPWPSAQWFAVVVRGGDGMTWYNDYIDSTWSGWQPFDVL